MKKRVFLIGILGALIFLVACSASAPEAKPAPPPAKDAAAKPAAEKAATPAVGLPKTPAVTQLYEAAKKEGEVNFSAFSTQEAEAATVKAFEEEFPGITIKIVREASPDTPPRIIREASAGRITVDVAKASLAGYLVPLTDRNLMASADWASLGVQKDLIAVDGKFLVQTNQVSVFAYNTNLVSAQDVPKTWEDLLNPKWKGKIRITTPGIAGAALFFTKDEQQVVKLLESLKGQNLSFENPAPNAQALVSGQFAIAETFIEYIVDLRGKGAPIGLTPIGPQLNLSTGIYVVNGGPHPNAAKLLAAWLVSPKAREITNKYEQRGISKPCTASLSAQEICDKKIELFDVDTFEKAQTRGNYQNRVSQILGSVPTK